MMVAAPWVLLGLLALPGIYFLLRITPTAPRRVVFPPVRLLQGLPPAPRSARRMPLWLLLLRLLVAALIILGLARPYLHPPAALPGNGPVLLVIDNGWAAAPRWPQTLAAARSILAAAQLGNRGVSLLATAPDASGAAPQRTGVLRATEAAQMLDGLRVQPWPADRRADTAALADAPHSLRIYLADGITDGPGFPAFIQALHPSRSIAGEPAPLLLPPSFDAGQLMAHVTGSGQAVLAQTASGAVLARAETDAAGNAVLNLPLTVSNQIARLAIAGATGAGSVFLLDAGRGGAVGVVTDAASETPFLGSTYFLRRALPGRTLTGDLPGLIAAKPSAIILADTALPPAQLRQASDWIANGGEVIRFSGPRTANAPDQLAAGPLLAGDRRLGGALSWSAPQHLAAPPASSPLAGLDPAQTTVFRQVLADPTRLDPASVWLRLADGTPLVLGKRIGKGLLVSVLTSANAEWSNLPLSGSYPVLLSRLTELGAGAPLRRDEAQPLRAALNGEGVLVAPAVPALLAPAQREGLAVSPAHPPGIYGDPDGQLALNLGGHVPPPEPARLPNRTALGDAPPPVALGDALIFAAAFLLGIDLLIGLGLRGLIPGFAALGLALMTAPAARAQGAPGAGVPEAALQTQLAYVETGDPATDQLSADALRYLSTLVSARTSAQLGSPAGVAPGTDDLGLYPLIYWPVLPGAPAPSPQGCAALTGYMRHGGLLLLDSQGEEAGGEGSGAGFAPGAGAALRRAVSCLALPPLEPLATNSTLAHCFYVLQAFPGRFSGAPVLTASPTARDPDGMTPILIGQNDWAGAWARDANGDPERMPLPGGEDQRVTADRFGVNLVIYALTGDYKSDQSRLPEFLQKLAP